MHALLTLAEAATNPAHADALGLQKIFETVTYIIAGVCFILSLRWLSNPATARRGNIVGQVGMAAAIIGALLQHEIIGYQWIIIGLVAGSLIGAPLAIWMPMTAVPQRTAFSHACGALAAALVGCAHYAVAIRAGGPGIDHTTMAILAVEVLLGALTFTGSLMAFGKLQELLAQRPITFKGQNYFNFLILGAALACGVLLTINPTMWYLFPVLLGLAMLFGVLLIIPIGGADMPTVIALLNSYAGLSASLMGFVLHNPLLIIAGALDGASGFILSIIMCKAMNRSFTNVLFGAFGQLQVKAGAQEKKSVRSGTPEEAAQIMEAAQSVIIIPGYGMAVAQAQHKVREMFDQLTKRGVDVKFAIHPVAGRMPGHMNVLLAEAEIPYDKLIEMDDINGDFPQCDVALVIGANDVVNPAARHDKNSPIFGMPILDADKAKTVMAIKRSMNPGFAGIENELYFADNCMMLFGDAKAVVGSVAKELAETALV
ncbi:MAG TPA: NAD(P)(+) transhydrogenase (Re/Si-specific) subunit beta [Phycisphaerae bacterium]|nr:NAD(P)(+) transhydrogenase (Re/Si-specific) subunit beta [Phycisphaerae bacterium]